MKAALTIWEDRISPVFDVSREALIIDIENHIVVNRKICAISGEFALDKINWFLKKNISALICGAISEAIYREFKFHQMTVNGFITGSIEDVIDAFLKGSIGDEKFLMPGCGRHSKSRNRFQRKRGQKNC